MRAFVFAFGCLIGLACLWSTDGSLQVSESDFSDFSDDTIALKAAQQETGVRGWQQAKDVALAADLLTRDKLVAQDAMTKAQQVSKAAEATTKRRAEKMSSRLARLVNLAGARSRQAAAVEPENQPRERVADVVAAAREQQATEFKAQEVRRKALRLTRRLRHRFSVASTLSAPAPLKYKKLPGPQQLPTAPHIPDIHSLSSRDDVMEQGVTALHSGTNVLAWLDAVAKETPSND